MEKTKLKAYLAWVTICIVWGTTYLAIKIGVTDLPPMLFAGVRWIVSGVLLLGVLLARGHKLPAKKEFIPLAIVGLMLLGVGNGLVVTAEIWLPSGLTALMITTLPFWAAIIESLAGGIKLNKQIMGGLVLGFLGVVLIFNNELSSLTDPSFLIGMFIVLIAMISWAGGSIYSKYKKLEVNHLVGAAVHMLVAGTVQTALGMILGEYNQLGNISTESILATAYLVVFGSMAGYGSYMYAIRHLSVSLVSTYAYVNPIIALFLGWLVLGENLSAEIIIAAVMIFTGVWIVRKGSLKAAVASSKFNNEENG